MRLILGGSGVATVSPAGGGGGDNSGSAGLTDEQLADVYAHPGAEAGAADGVWWRVNMITTLDGAGVDANGHSAGFGSEADHRVFHLLRSLCDVVVVGAGTARAEEYDLARHSPLVVVSGRGRLPESVAEAFNDSGAEGDVLLATCESAAPEQIASERDFLGFDNVLVCPGRRVDARWLRGELAARGFARVLAEGGPSLLGDQFAAGVVDELCLTISPMVAGGEGGRIVAGAELGDGVRLDLHSVVESDGMLLTRWVPSPKQR